jgi:hypothetical protein
MHDACQALTEESLALNENDRSQIRDEDETKCVQRQASRLLAHLQCEGHHCLWLVSTQVPDALTLGECGYVPANPCGIVYDACDPHNPLIASFGGTFAPFCRGPVIVGRLVLHRSDGLRI